MLWSKGIVEGQRKAFIGKEGRRGGSRGEAVERSRRHEAVLLVLDLSLQFHPPVLKPGLDLRNKREGWREGGGTRGEETAQYFAYMCKMQTTAVRWTFPCFNCLG